MFAIRLRFVGTSIENKTNTIQILFNLFDFNRTRLTTDKKKKFSTLNKTTKFSNLFNRDEKKINKLLFDFITCKTTIKNIFV